MNIALTHPVPCRRTSCGLRCHKAVTSVLAITLLLLAAASSIRAQAPGSLDVLNVNVVGVYVTATAVQPDGKTIIAGNFTSVLGVARSNIARLNADGTLDMGFDPNPTANTLVSSVAVQPDGKILLGGQFTTLQPNGALSATARQYVARVNADGSLDAGFDPKANNYIQCVTVQADGKILLGGQFTTLQPNGALSATARQYVARVNADGSLDTGFDPKASASVYSLVVQEDAKILIGGGFTNLQPNGAATATTRYCIARLNADGSLDTGFDPKANNQVACVAVQADGKILIAGDFITLQPNEAATTTTRNHIARVNADGSLDSSFDPNPGPAAFIASVAVQANGKILLGGSFTTLQPNGALSTTARQHVARLNADGSLDAGFDPKANSGVLSVAVQADGKILLGGTFTTLQPNGAASATTRNLFARLNNDAATQTLSALDTTQVQWLRGGAAPEVSHVTFEQSSDGGVNWTNLGNGTRLGNTANWKLVGLTLPGSGQLRARGRTTANGGYHGGSGLVETVASYPAPEISVEQSALAITNGATKSFATVTIGSTADLVFAILNTGTADLTMSGTPYVVVSGTDAALFSVIAQPASPVVTSGSTTFTVRFAPTNVGAKTASIFFPNNDSDENPFQISLTGVGVIPITDWRQQYFGSAVNSGDGADLNDFEYDGLPNLVEYAFGLNPILNSAGQLPQAQKVGGNFGFSFTEPPGVTGITYGAEWSTTMAANDWHAITDTGTAPQHTFSVPIGSNPGLFIRLRVTLP